MSEKRTDYPDLELNNPFLQQAIKKAKLKQLVKYVLITIITTILLVGLFIWGTDYLLNQRLEKMDHSHEQIIGANISYVGTYTVDSNLFSKTTESLYRKSVGNRSILWETKTEKIPLFGKTEVIHKGSGLTKIQQHNDNSQRQIRYNNLNNEAYIDFYYPQLDYNDLPNELKIATELSDEKFVEVALSFKRPIPVTEVEEHLGTENVNWLWVDTMNEEQSDNNNINNVKAGESSVGFHINSEIELNEGTSQEFIKILKQYASSSELIKTSLKRIKENTEESDGVILISGAVVTGTPEELQRFLEVDLIRASVIGATVDQY